jgi:hypothetical protein
MEFTTLAAKTVGMEHERSTVGIAAKEKGWFA